MAAFDDEDDDAMFGTIDDLRGDKSSLLVVLLEVFVLIVVMVEVGGARVNKIFSGLISP